VNAVSLVLPYYKNPGMLAEQYRVWSAYPADLREAVEVVLVDDGSPAGSRALEVPRPAALPALRIYQVLVDLPWHQHGARNLGASEAIGPWLLLTDMDHVVPAASLRDLLTVLPLADRRDVFTFHRVDAPHGTPTRDARGGLKPHVNTFALTRAHYWAVGGYDEDCVGYGTDGFFRGRLNAMSNRRHLAGIPIVRYPREVVADASTAEPGVDPRALRNAGRQPAETARRQAAKRARGATAPTVLAFPWERVL
jgi:GT2 family glycosyltransferase